MMGEEFEEGEVVIIIDYNDSLSKHKVDKITPKGWVKVDDCFFKKDKDYRIYGDWNSKQLIKFNDELWCKEIKRRVRNYVKENILKYIEKASDVKIRKIYRDIKDS